MLKVLQILKIQSCLPSDQIKHSSHSVLVIIRWASCYRKLNLFFRVISCVVVINLKICLFKYVFILLLNLNLFKKSNKEEEEKSKPTELNELHVKIEITLLTWHTL